MKKILFIANSDRHIKLCHIPYMKLFKDNGYVVHVATNSSNLLDYCDKKINLHLKRNPYSFLNLFALFKVRRLVKKEGYDVISCHTPIGGFLGRCSVIFRKKKTKVFYTAHGFHFYRGASIINWLIYYPIEKFLSRWSDAIITMNEEDYNLAKSKFFTDVYKVHGIGMNEDKLIVKDKSLRKRMNLKKKFVVTYIAEISKRKNQFMFLDALSNYKLDKDIIFLFIGDTVIKNVEKKFSKYKNVKYISFRDNVGDYINMSDLIISLSKQEGLPQNILEAMYFNKMVIATNIRGNKDLINEKNGILVDDMDSMIREIIKYKNNGGDHINNDISDYRINKVIEEHINIYNKYLDKKIDSFF